jgi:transposase
MPSSTSTKGGDIMGTRIKRSRRRLYPEEELAIERMVFEGIDDGTISEMLGISQSMVKTQRKTAEFFRNAIKSYKERERRRDVRRETEKRLLETLKEGDAYMLGYGTKGMNWGRGKYLYERPMVYKGALKNATGKMLFMFTSSTGGWTETFTAEQLKDMEIERVDHA